MQNQISPLGWFLIILVVLLTVSLYISLFSKLRNKSDNAGWINSIQNAQKILKDPFREQTSKIEELARNVEKLQQNKEKTNNSENTEQETKRE
mgnify:CR=1 FL=1